MPMSWFLLVYFVAAILALGAAVGAIVGMGVGAFFKNGWLHVGWDATFGAIGLFGTIVLFKPAPISWAG